MIRALIALGALWWGFPIVAFAVTALLTDKPHVFLAVSGLALCSIGASGLAIGIAMLRDDDVFEFAVIGAIIGLLVGGWPMSWLFLS